MRLLLEDCSLKNMNNIFEVEIQRYRILGDLPLDYQDFLQVGRIGVFYGQ